MEEQFVQFQIPIHPEDLLNDTAPYSIEAPLSADSLSEKKAKKLLEEISSRLGKATPQDIVQHDNFDPLFNLLSKFTSLDQSVLEHIFELLRSGLNNLVASTTEMLHDETTNEQLNTYKNALKMYMFLLHWFLSMTRKAPTTKAQASTATKEKGRGRKSAKKDAESGPSWNTESQKETVLSTMIHVLELDLSRVWKMTYPEDEFLNLFATTSYAMLEDPANTKSKPVKRCLFLLVSILVKKYNQALGVINSLINLLHKFEHLPVPIAELIEVMVTEYHCTQVVGDIIREIGKMNPKEARDSSGVKNVSIFIAELGDRIPRNVLPLISVLLPHLNGESYMMRNGIIQLLGFLVAKAFTEDKNPESQSEAREDLLNILEQRFRDMNSYTRCRVLQTWQYLYQQKCVPLNRVSALLAATIDRLRDKAAQARKCAVQLLTTLLQYNPYSPSLKLSEFSAKLTELKNANKSRKESDEEEANPDDKQQRVIKFCADAVDFITQIHNAVPVICQLLGSNNASDVSEAIRFFIAATTFNIENAQVGIRKMLMLVWNKEAGVKDAVINAYHHLYISDEENPANKEPARIAKNLITLTVKASLGELTSLEELLVEMMKKQYISSSVIQILWDIFAMRYGKSSKKTPLQSRGALIVLSMLGSADSEIIRSKLNVLVQVGLGPRWKEDEFLARYTCVALQKLSKKTAPSTNDKEKKETVAATRLKATHPLFQKLSDIVNDRSVPITKWYPAAEQAINTIYMLNEKPDACCASIVKEWAAILFPSIVAEKKEGTLESDINNCSVFDLSKFLFLLGHVALKQLIHIEEIQNEIRKRRSDTSKTSKSKKEKKEKEAIEEELGVAAAAEENEVEFLQDRAEKEIVGKNLLGTFTPVINLICANAGNRFNLSNKLILFSDKHLQLLFTILQTAPEPSIRSNIIIALGDLAFRFPNLIEPWTQNLYGVLRDKDPKVRKNTLMVLSHLILNDMIKVKGQISEMAVCMEDEDSRISDLAKLFFHELSQKANTIYNILPDLISSISNSSKIRSESFRTIMKYLFSFIAKEKQAESLVEKLCHRFRTAKDTQECRNISYCLSLLNYNDKAIKKLSELHKTYQDKLSDEDVMQSFSTILSKTKKFAKQELKDALVELESKINLTETPEGEEGAEPNENAPAAPKAKPTTKTRGAARGRGRGRGKAAASGRTTRGRAKKVAYSDDEEDEQEESPPTVESESEASQEEEPSPPKKKRAAPAKKAAVEEKEDSGEGSEESEEAEEPKPKPQPKKRAPPKKKPARGKAAKKKVQSESESESNNESDNSDSQSD